MDVVTAEARDREMESAEQVAASVSIPADQCLKKGQCVNSFGAGGGIPAQRSNQSAIFSGNARSSSPEAESSNG